MPLTAFALVLLAALLHACWNIAAKQASANPHFATLGSLLVVVLWAPLGLWAAWGELPGWGWRAWGLTAASGLLHLAYFQVLLQGYRLADLSVVYPVARGTGPLVSALGAVLLLGESLGLAGGAGVLAVCGGIVLIAGGPALWRNAQPVASGDVRVATARRARIAAGLRWGAATGLLIASYTLVDGYAVKRLAVSPILIDYLGNALRLVVLLAVSWRDRPGLRAAWAPCWRQALVMAGLSPLAYVLVLYAARMAPLSHVAPAREVSMLFAALLGGRLLGEQDRGWRALGALLMAGGVALLASGAMAGR